MSGDIEELVGDLKEFGKPHIAVNWARVSLVMVVGPQEARKGEEIDPPTTLRLICDGQIVNISWPLDQMVTCLKCYSAIISRMNYHAKRYQGT